MLITVLSTSHVLGHYILTAVLVLSYRWENISTEWLRDFLKRPLQFAMLPF